MDNGFIRCELLQPSQYDPRRTGLRKERIETIRDRFDTPALLKNETEFDIYRLIRSARAELSIGDTELAALWVVFEIALDIANKPENLRASITYLTESGPAGQKNEVCTGMRRYLAHILAGEEFVRAEPVWYPDLPERIRAELRDNLERNDLSDIEMILLLKFLQDQLEAPISVRRIKVKTGKGHGTAQQIRRILNEANEPMYELMRDGHFTSINGIITALNNPTVKPIEPLNWFSQSFLRIDVDPSDREFILLTINDLMLLLDSKLEIARGCDETLAREISECMDEMQVLFEEQRNSILLDQSKLQYMLDRMMYCQRRCYDQIQNMISSNRCVPS